MDKNTPERQQHIIKNLRIEKDEIKEVAELENVVEDLEIA